MRILYDLYQKFQRPDEGVNIGEGKITNALKITPRKRTKVFIPDAPLSLSELYAHPENKPLKEGYVPIGLLKNGELAQSTWQGMTCGVIAGNRNWGKSGILKSMTFHALHARAQGFHCKISIFDPHHNLPDAYGTFFKPVLHQFNHKFLGSESLEEGTFLPFFDSLDEQVKQAQKGGFDESTPWNIIIIDEADVLLKSRYGKKAYDLIVALINLRKARIFFLLSFADTTKEGSGKHGTGIVTAGSTIFCVRYTPDKARRILPGPGEAQKTVNLSLGYAAVKIPPRDPSEDPKLQICKMPLVTEADLKPFE